MGVVLEGAYPKNVSESLNDDDLLTIFSTHAISEKAGVMAMRIKRLNIISYYSGLPEGERTDQFFVALILDPDEDPNPYEEGLSEIANMIIPMVGKPGFEEFFAESFDRISKYLSISEEQRYSFIFRDNVRRLLLERLANGPMTKEGLAKWISKEIGEEITDIEGLLNPLRKTDLIEEINISKGKKVTLEFVFLIRDVAVIRTPNVELFKAAKSGQMAADIRDKYIDEVTRFFKEYRITGQDCVLIANSISDPDMYDVIRVLREQYVTKAELPMKIGREIPNLDKILKKMATDKIIVAIPDKKERVWILLLSDISFPNFFPEYMVDVIRRRWKEGTIQKDIALKHLELLRAEYIATQAPKFRKKYMNTLKVIFGNAEKSISKRTYDRAATMLDQVAGYCRDMGERKTADLIDQASKSIREDKDQYVEEHWEEARIQILKDFEDIEQRDLEKLHAKKAQKQKVKAQSKQSKKQAELDQKAAAKEKKSKKSKNEVLPQREPEAEEITLDASVSSSGEVQAQAQTSQKTGNLKEIQKTIKSLLKKGPTEELMNAYSELAAAFRANGDEKKAAQADQEANQIYVQLYLESEKQFAAAAKQALKSKDYANAAQCFGELVNISNVLFKMGLMQYSERVKKYESAKVEAENMNL